MIVQKCSRPRLFLLNGPFMSPNQRQDFLRLPSLDRGETLHGFETPATMHFFGTFSAEQSMESAHQTQVIQATSSERWTSCSREDQDLNLFIWDICCIITAAFSKLQIDDPILLLT